MSKRTKFGCDTLRETDVRDLKVVCKITRRQATYAQRKFEACSCNHCSGAICITYNVSMSVSLGIQHAMRERQIVICGLPGCIIFFYIISKMARFSKKKLLNIKLCVDFIYNFVWKILILKRIERHIIWNVQWSHIKYPLFGSNFNETWIFSTDFRGKNIFWKSAKWEPSCSMWMDRQKDRHDEDNSSFSQLCERAQKLGVTIFEDHHADKKRKLLNVKCRTGISNQDRGKNFV